VCSKGDPETHLKVYQPGEAFGELALLYNAPRAATIIAKTECVLFSLDRQTFNHIVKDSAAKKREKYE
jgi:cAMP-dependent protein kinase regulator